MADDIVTILVACILATFATWVILRYGCAHGLEIPPFKCEVIR